VRSNPVIGGDAIVNVEVGARHRIWVQTIVFAGIGSEISDQPDRPRVLFRVGISHVF
jgi:hypothetical protein